MDRSRPPATSPNSRPVLTGPSRCSPSKDAGRSACVSSWLWGIVWPCRVSWRCARDLPSPCLASCHQVEGSVSITDHRPPAGGRPGTTPCFRLFLGAEGPASSDVTEDKWSPGARPPCPWLPPAPSPRQCLWPSWEPLAGVGHVLELEGAWVLCGAHWGPLPTTLGPAWPERPSAGGAGSTDPAAPGFLRPQLGSARWSPAPMQQPVQWRSLLHASSCPTPPHSLALGAALPHKTIERCNPVSSEARSLL